MARQTSRRRVWTGVALATALLAVGAGAWGLQQWAPFADDVAAPTWPDNVQPVVDFVEDATDQAFIAPVTIRFVADDDNYRSEVQPEGGEPTDDERAAAATDEGVARALGLWAGDTSVVALHDAYDSVDPLPITWLADDNTIVINARHDAELSPMMRAELSVRLTQALDNQLFHTIEDIQRAPSSQHYQALVGVSVGHAVWVHDLYVDQLPEDDLDDYYTASDKSGAVWAEAMAEVPVAYRAIRAVGQQIGPMFIEALSEEGRTLVAKAMSSAAPAALDQVSLPTSKYLRRDETEPVTKPPGPAGAEVQFTNQMGPFASYLLFSTGLPANVALTASDGWGNDSYTVYILDGRVCVDAHFVADSPNDAERFESGLNGWAQARPDEADVLVGRDGTDLYATACDPGVDVQQSVPSEDAVQHYLARAQELQLRADSSGDPALAECVAVAFYGAYDVEVLDDSFDYYTELDNIEQDCLDAT